VDPTFSVIVPTYNRPKMLRDAVDSVLAQDDGDFECVIVDDGGNDPIELPADPRLRVARTDRNHGVAHALNVGIDAARGDYVTFLDDDDRFTRDRLSMTRAALGRAPVVLCWAQVVGRPRPRPGESGARRLEGNVHDTILDDRAPPRGATVIARSAVPRFDERYHALEDLEWWLRVTNSLAVTTVEQFGYLIRVHDARRHRNDQIERIRFGRLLVAEHLDYFRSHRRAAAMRWFSMGLVARELGDQRYARRAMARSLRIRPVPKRVGHLALTVRPNTPATSVERMLGARDGATGGAGCEPLVSVVLPVFNGAATVSDAIRSILGQSLERVELIVVDDASTDGTGAVTSALRDPRVRIITHGARRGLVASLNAGVAAASTDVIARIDADDLAHPDRLARQYEIVRAAPEAGLVATAYRAVDDRGRDLGYVGVPDGHAATRLRLMFGCCIAHATVMFRRDVFERAGRYYDDEFPAEDYGLWLRMTEVAQVATIASAEATILRGTSGVSAVHGDEQIARTCALAGDTLERITGARPSERIVAGLAGVGDVLDCHDFADASAAVISAYDRVRRDARERGESTAALSWELRRLFVRSGAYDASHRLCVPAVARVAVRHPAAMARAATSRLTRRAEIRRRR
jgi:glycosyltransferase involved in cell wall biosynthesis